MSVVVETHDGIEAAARAAGSDGHLMGGGTLIMRAVNYGEFSGRILRCTDPALARIEARGERAILGAGVTMAAIMAHRETAFLAAAARAVGGPAIRTMATVGGNLFAPHPYGDFAAALLALGAGVQLAGGREMPVDELLAARERTPRPVVAAVSVPRPGQGAFRFRKVTRVRPKGVSVMSIAALLPVSAGRIAGARIVFGAMGPAPLRARAAERALQGQALDATGIAAALEVATEGLAPPTDALASEWYRREVAPIHLRRLLLGED